jgi:hypothetical protein
MQMTAQSTYRLGIARVTVDGPAIDLTFQDPARRNQRRYAPVGSPHEVIVEIDEAAVRGLISQVWLIGAQRGSYQPATIRTDDGYDLRVSVGALSVLEVGEIDDSNAIAVAMDDQAWAQLAADLALCAANMAAARYTRTDM